LQAVDQARTNVRLSLGCLGKVPVSPWWAFAVDVTALGGLALFYQRWEMRALSKDLGVIAVGGLLALVFLGGVMLILEPHQSLTSSLRGEALAITSGTVDVGSGTSGEWRRGELTVKNVARAPVRIAGAATDCSFRLISPLPILLQPGEHATMTISIGLPAGPGPFSRSLTLFIEHGGMRRHPFEVTGYVEK
jgi:hypothetical protein